MKCIGCGKHFEVMTGCNGCGYPSGPISCPICGAYLNQDGPAYYYSEDIDDE
jgi:predicted amidophosphoribosyltransferase